MLTLELRPYQKKIIDNIKSELKSAKNRICIQSSCGSGKSIIEGVISRDCNIKGNRVLFIVHRKELCEQIEQTFLECDVNFDLTQIGMIQTITRHLDEIKEPKVIIIDECHHVMSKSYFNVINKFPNAIILGFTATPVRLNEGGLGKIFNSMIKSESTKWLIDNKYLSPYKLFSKKLVDIAGISVKGDFLMDELAILMEKKFIYGETIKNYNRLAANKKTIVYCASIKSSEDTCQEFNNAGIQCAHLDGNTPKDKRAYIINQFRIGEITVLCNVDLFGEGFDVPDCECVILLRPTKSLTLYIQQSMRAMRYMESKEAIIIDHVGNVFEHGLPDGDRDWTLDSKGKNKKSEVHIKECPVCFRCMNITLSACPYCGFVFIETIQEREERKLIEANLEQINANDLLMSKPYEYHKQINDFETMKQFAKLRKYKFAWVLRKCLSRNIPIPDKYDGLLYRLGLIQRKEIL